MCTGKRTNKRYKCYINAKCQWKKSWKMPKRIITSRKWKDRLKKANRKNTAGQTMIYKTVHRKVKAEQHKPHLNPGVKSGALKGYNKQ